MPLITTDEFTRGVLVVVCGSAAGGAALAFPGTALWLVPAIIGIAGTSLTVPEVRQEIRQALPDLSRQARSLLPDTLPTMPRLIRRPAEMQTPVPAQTDAPRARDPLLAALDAEPHRLIIGHTGGGKTTLMHALAIGWAAEKQMVVVFDPDAAPGQWPGCRVAGGGDDYEAIGEGLVIVAKEIKRRRELRAEGQRTFPPAQILIDEAHDVIAEVPEAKTVMRALGRRGRKLNMHLTLGVQDKQMKTLDLDGETHLLRNFQTVDVMLRDGQRVAVVQRSDGNVTMPVPSLYDPEDFILSRQADTPSPAAISPDDALLESLLTGSAPGTSSAASHRPGTRPGTGSESRTSTSTGPGSRTSSEGGSGSSESVRTSIEDGGHTIRVDVRAHAEVARPTVHTGRRRPWRKPTGPASDEYQRVKTLVAQKKSGNVIQRELGLGRIKCQELVRRAKKELGHG